MYFSPSCEIFNLFWVWRRQNLAGILPLQRTAEYFRLGPALAYKEGTVCCRIAQVLWLQQRYCEAVGSLTSMLLRLSAATNLLEEKRHLLSNCFEKYCFQASWPRRSALWLEDSFMVVVESQHLYKGNTFQYEWFDSVWERLGCHKLEPWVIW